MNVYWEMTQACALACRHCRAEAMPTPAPNELSTIEGSMQLSGTGHWVGSRLRFEGVASAAPEHEAALANLLNIIGRRNGARSIITLG